MSDLTGQGGELRATIHIRRKETGRIDTYELIGPVTPEQEKQLLEGAVLVRIQENLPPRRDHGTAGAMQGPGAAVNNAPKD